jgi:hypothetical protein
MATDLKKLKGEVAKLSEGDFKKFGTWFNRLEEEREYRKLTSDKNGIPYSRLFDEFKKRAHFVWKGDTPEIRSALSAAIQLKEFYEKKRVRGCPLDEDADTLIAEWWAESEKEFGIDFIRQVVPPRHPDRDTEIWQLRIELRFPMSPELKRIKRGAKSCRSLDTFDWLDVVRGSRLATALEDMPPTHVSVTYENME